MQIKIVLTILILGVFISHLGGFVARPVLAETKSIIYEAKISLLDGWNLFTLPVDPHEDLPASRLLKAIIQDRGLATTVARWENGRWEEFVSRPNGEVYGTDFPIELGRSYFIRNYNKIDFRLSGEKLSGSRKLTLGTGYNFVGFPNVENSQSASKLLSEIGKVVSNASPEVSQFSSGLFQSFTMREGKPFGKDFAIDRFGGIVIKVDQPVAIEVK